LRVVVAWVERRVRGGNAGQPIVAQSMVVASLVVVAATVEPEQRLGERERFARRERVDELVVRLEEVIALAVVRERVEAPGAGGIPGDAAVQVVGGGAGGGGGRLPRAAVEIYAKQPPGDGATRRQHGRTTPW